MAGYYRIEMSPLEYKSGVPAQHPDQPSFSVPGLQVWSEDPVINMGDFGCIIGHLFTRTDPSNRILSLTDRHLDAIRNSEGRSLLDDFWGGYVAIIARPDGDVSVLRDPSGLLPCYYRSDPPSLVLGNDVDDLAVRGPGSVDFTEVGRFLTSLDGMGRKTCLSDVAELVPGECITWSTSSTAISAWWSPWPSTSLTGLVRFETVACRLRQVVLDCVNSWTSCFQTILLGVSGGLDSSIVATGISQGHSTLQCLNLVGNDPGGDERRYASVLAAVLGLPLHEIWFDLAAINLDDPVAPNHPWPGAPYFMQAISATHAAFRNEYPFDAHFSGNGGDNVFCSLYTAAPFVDRFMCEGPSSGLMTTLRDLSKLTGADGMTILRHAWDIHRRVGAPPRIYRDPSGLSLSFVEALGPSQPLHPWLDPPDGALPGKIGHVKQIVRAHRSLELYPRRTHPAHIAPLLSQPILEMCLNIPTWQWIHGGNNRAAARAAFQGFLPQELLTRTSKGGPSGFMREIYQAHSGKAQEMLRDGLLARAGMLDLSIFKGADPLTVEGSDKARRILGLCAAEAWVRWWSDAI
ncbi:MAG: hypothetical protein KYX66_15850 [Blastomonas fulva]|uniref:asparagine synthase-related protein n=1 Tax=Blastomonas fulva TaxID=1550728 RepID=UPI0024E24966|nr:asparagine synthase-related protein [Blastomonas fulva]MDK2758199.1 hypothetical protein [Blastomonas fulva]